MIKRTRYILIASGFVFFLIAAPVIVLYVRGISYDFSAKSFIKTGIMAVRVTPANADIFLNGQLKRQNQGDMRFLIPGEYQIKITKTGYSDWNKRLNVKAEQVTWASPAFGSIYLFFKNPPIQNLAREVLDFYSQNGNFIYLTKDALTASSLNNPDNRLVYPLPANVNKIAAWDDSGKNFALINSAATSSAQILLIFNKISGRLTDISSLFAGLPKIQFGQNGQLYALSNNTLYLVNLQNKTKIAVFNDVKSFYFQGDMLYYIQQTGKNYGLFVGQSPFSQNQLLLAGLPDFDSGNLFVTFEKEIFLLADGKLYSASSAMRQLSDNISGFSFDPSGSLLSVIHSGELDFYDPLTGNLNFVTRSSEALTNPKILSSIGNAFFFQGQKLMAIELDARDSQNQYQLYQGSNVQKFYIDDAGKNILLLDNGALKSLVIR